MSYVQFLRVLAFLWTALAQFSASAAEQASIAQPTTPPLRVIVDTDIGDDIDDSWALAFLLASKAIDVRLVVTAGARAQERSWLLAKFLQAAGESVPIGIGKPIASEQKVILHGWANESDLLKYPGVVHQDGVQAIIDEVRLGRAQGQETYIVEIAPEANLAEAIARAPDLFQEARRDAASASLVVMGGSVFKGDNMSAPAYTEWNVQCDPESVNTVLGNATWRRVPTMAPLDSSSGAQIFGEYFRRLRHSPSRIARALLEMNEAWVPKCPWPPPVAGPWCAADVSSCSSVLYDLEAATLLPVFPVEEIFQIRRLRTTVTSDGHIALLNSSQPGAVADWALAWLRGGLQRWQELVVETLSGAAAASSWEQRLLV
eukprot:TRINITY_DN18730_c2_g1_i2.p1 TRINITY_DN18730_c2_g1~~TRINITY_DN18730_c2_g1_i2.p1  ORF type:complete len:403 (-),score=60.66 TRINITY_DN18730_c2_g1_i2:29-1150(-)